MIRLSLLILVSISLINCQSPAANPDRNIASDVTPAKFCENIMSKKPESGKSLKHLRVSLVESGVVPRGAYFGTSSSSAERYFYEFEFANLLRTNPTLLDNPSQIPEGSVLLMRQGEGCKGRVKTRHGHVGVQCNSKLVTLDPPLPERIHADFKKCIYAVMLPKRWLAFDEGDNEETAHP